MLVPEVLQFDASIKLYILVCNWHGHALVH